ncbi:MAG: Hsp70 family protein [Cyanobacteria bacterium P01_D01_bin.73]
MTIAIDFGTSNTVVSRWNPGTQKPETLTLPGLSIQQVDNPAVIPSLLYVESASAEKIVAGQTVRDRGLDGRSGSRFFRGFKRGIGTEIQGFLPELDGHTITFEQVGEWFLNSVAEQVRSAGWLDGQGGSELILTVPVDSFEVYRSWLSQAIASTALGQVERLRLLDEPTAAALSYDGSGDRELMLVIDFGGGTLDISLVKIDNTKASRGTAQPLGFLMRWGNEDMNQDAQVAQTAQVLAKAGINLGGTDIDNWLMDFFVEKQGVTPSPLISRLVERVKLKLSQNDTASEVFFDDETLDSVELSLNRQTFSEILESHGFFEQLSDLMEQVLQQGRRHGIDVDDIEGVLLVGGTSKVPAVQRWLSDYFPEDKILKNKPLEAIAHGALQLAQGVTVKDFLYHGYGVRYWNRRDNRHDWHPIISKGQPYPMMEAVDLTLGASVNNQPRIELVIGELGEESGTVEVFFEGDRIVTKQTSGKRSVKALNDRDGARNLATLDPPGMPGTDRVRVSFRVDEQRHLRVSVDDLLANERLLDEVTLVQLS